MNVVGNIRPLEGERVQTLGPEPPRRLFRETLPPEPFPVDALGPILAPVAKAITDLTQTSPAICANSVLGVAALAVQGLANIETINGQSRPLSLFLLTVAASGERKTSADKEATIGVREREKELREDFKTDQRSYKNALAVYEATRADALKVATKQGGSLEDGRDALDALGEEPSPPRRPIMLMTEPTIEGMVRLLAESSRTMGLFSSEGGSFIGGHAMSAESKTRTGARLSSIWDGDPIDRVRASGEASILVGRRLSVHLMAQPQMSAAFLADSDLKNQGFLPRFLISAPAEAAGTRLFREPDPRSRQIVRQFANRVGDLLRSLPVLADEDELPTLGLEREARALLIEWHDTVERDLGPGGKFAPIKAFGSKLTEHATRLAGVLTLIADPKAQFVSAEATVYAIELANFFAGETLRLAEAAQVSEQLRVAERLRVWLAGRGTDVVHLAEVYQKGPNEIRDRASAASAVKTLEDHGHLRRIDGGAEIDGCHRRDAWRFVNAEERP